MMGANSASTAGLDARVLIVDDVAGNRAILIRRLTRLGYECIEADSGRAALDLLQGELPDIILLDYMMPDMNGIDTLRLIKADNRLRNVPVIMVTAKTSPEAIAETLALGAEDYVSKPLDFTNLNARMKNVLQRTRDHSELRKINSTLDERVTMRGLEVAQIQEDLNEQIDLRMRMQGDQIEVCRRCIELKQVDASAKLNEIDRLLVEIETILGTTDANATDQTGTLEQAADILSQARKKLADF